MNETNSRKISIEEIGKRLARGKDLDDLSEEIDVDLSYDALKSYVNQGWKITSNDMRTILANGPDDARLLSFIKDSDINTEFNMGDGIKYTFLDFILDRDHFQ